MSNETRKPRQHMGNRGRSVEKAKDFKGTMKKLIKYLAPYKFTFIFGLLAAVFSVVISVIGPKIVGISLLRLRKVLWPRSCRQVVLTLKKFSRQL